METKKTRKLVPKGTSEYQAAWIIEDEEEEEDSEDEVSLSLVCLRTYLLSPGSTLG